MARAAAQAHNEPANAGGLLAPTGAVPAGSSLTCEVAGSEQETAQVS